MGGKGASEGLACVVEWKVDDFKLVEDAVGVAVVVVVDGSRDLVLWASAGCMGWGRWLGLRSFCWGLTGSDSLTRT